MAETEPTPEESPIAGDSSAFLTEIHILGFTQTRRDAPWDRYEEPGLEIWGINNLHIMGDIPHDRCHRWFDLHPQEVQATDPNHLKWLEGWKRPIYMFEEPAIELADFRRFPVDAVTDAFATKYFTNSISWLMAFAGLELQPALKQWKTWCRVNDLAEDLKWTDKQREKALADLGIVDEPIQPKVGVHGVDMATDTEYGAQRPSCEYFLGVLAGAGFQVEIARASDLLRTAGMYGLDDNGALRAKMLSRKSEVEEALHRLQADRSETVNKLGQLDGGIAHHNGVLSDLQYWLDRWTMPEIDREAASKPGQLTDAT